MKTHYLLLFKNSQLLLKDMAATFILPLFEDVNQWAQDQYPSFVLYEEDDDVYNLVEVDDDFPTPDGYVFMSLRDCRDHHKTKAYALATQGLQLHNWSCQHKYCGVCGHAFKPMSAGRSKSCPNCGNVMFPQTSVAVITAIFKEGKILLAHNANFPDGLYSLIAGFVELGESFEEAVHRETFEEVGIQVKNIRYFRSQPWPFPNSTMVGFMADYDGGELQVDGTEILDANWYTPDDFPLLPDPYSIARQMIEHYKNNL